jgi:ferric-dicitrate binding protein FerR (iron transport regulator)
MAKYNTRSELLEMIRRYMAGGASAAEKEFLDAYYDFHDRGEDAFARMPAEEKARLEEQLLTDTWAMIGRSNKPKINPVWPRIIAAASIVLAIGAGYYFFHIAQLKKAQQNAETLMPARKGVTLTLGNGTRVDLHKEQIRQADGVSVVQASGRLSYAATNAPVVWQTLTNHDAAKYGLELADGTEVFLDINSSISYPTAFRGRERRVKLQGQAYFRVKHNAARPFYVDAAGEQVEDIGTAFNIDAYGSPKTTLVEGVVRVGDLTLKPGEQAVVRDGKEVAIAADIEEVTSWLQGKIVFNREPLENIMAKVARIYDVKVVWMDQGVKKLTFGGGVNRTKKLALVLDYFRRSGPVDFVVEGKTVKVFARAR